MEATPITIRAASLVLCVTERTVRLWVQRHTIPTFEGPRGRLVKLQDFEARLLAISKPLEYQLARALRMTSDRIDLYMAQPQAKNLTPVKIKIESLWAACVASRRYRRTDVKKALLAVKPFVLVPYLRDYDL